MTSWSSSRTARTTPGPITLKPANSRCRLKWPSRGELGGARNNQRVISLGALEPVVELIKEEIKRSGSGRNYPPP